MRRIAIQYAIRVCCQTGEREANKHMTHLTQMAPDMAAEEAKIYQFTVTGRLSARNHHHQQRFASSLKVFLSVLALAHLTRQILPTRQQCETDFGQLSRLTQHQIETWPSFYLKPPIQKRQYNLKPEFHLNPPEVNRAAISAGEAINA